MLRSRAKGWLQRENHFCSSLMEERVSNVQVLRVWVCTVCLVCGVFAAGGSFLMAGLFVAGALVCCTSAQSAEARDTGAPGTGVMRCGEDVETCWKEGGVLS